MKRRDFLTVGAFLPILGIGTKIANKFDGESKSSSQSTGLNSEFNIKASPSEIGTKLFNPNQTFATFNNEGNGVPWTSAYSTSSYDLEKDSFINPLFLYGPPSSGKSHLLNAIGNRIKLHNSQLRIMLISSEMFTLDFVKHVRRKNLEGFRKKYMDNYDIFMMDDFQFIDSRAAAVQKEFKEIAKLFIKNNKLIVVAGTHAPEKMKGINDELHSYFKSGVVSEMIKINFKRS